ncbi:glycosyltransferase [Lichenihabitans psoromatis]|uniref:glycosyltransferase n=1 Tax=Lichenihabitans psoromatis TaxID=2528642 RepID=UPI001FDFCE77|nr:glycosyltransferase [Lichenihabitans psoromatis]
MMGRRLTVLSVGYPLARVSTASAGGAEQILACLDRAIVAAGHRSIVVAPEGSLISGELHPIEPPREPFDDAAKALAQRRTRVAIDTVRASGPIDVIHLHGIDFPAYLPGAGVPVLATLHLPSAWYPADALAPMRPDTWLHCVSDSQHQTCPPSGAMLPPIPNGIAVEAFAATRHRKRGFALFLGRICPEKGVHLAIEAARRAGLRLVIAGETYPYAEHQLYAEREIRPHLGPSCRFIGPVGFTRKRRLLGAAQCLLVPSLAAETSSLVAREAAASGTPVIAFRVGAMAETVRDGQTGFLVEDVAAMAEAARQAVSLDPDLCRAVARAHFSDIVMTTSYLDLYARLADPDRAGRRP